MDTLENYRQNLATEPFVRAMINQGWEPIAKATIQPGLYYMAVGLCELTGAVLKGAACYEPDARWVTIDTDTGAPQVKSGTGWCFLALDSGLVSQDKEIFYVKKFNRTHAAQIPYKWVKTAC